MGLSSALATAMSGLRANQAALSIVSSNIANAQTPGYVNQSAIQVETTTGDTGSTVSVIGVNRHAFTGVQVLELEIGIPIGIQVAATVHLPFEPSVRSASPLPDETLIADVVGVNREALVGIRIAELHREAGDSALGEREVVPPRAAIISNPSRPVSAMAGDQPPRRVAVALAIERARIGYLRPGRAVDLP